ncbi:MAG: GDP-mannose 4,6-dehydratase [Bacteroidetes bacterium]|nr:GDP-mannose 4,6-dehydratase [Bacteroidota bacterium]
MAEKKKHILVTGGAGFIGSHLVEKLLENNYSVTTIDNFDPFYAKEVKLKNISSFHNHPSFKLVEMDIVDADALYKNLTDEYDAIIHLAAKAGVRPSIENPVAYQDVNVKGTHNLLEFAKNKKIQQFVFSSSSSVYGVNKNYPWRETDSVLNPISPYASTKISGELLGHVYAHLYNIRFIALRFFTVFGPRQRPDLAIHLFSKKILNDQPIPFFGDGSTRRDYTYVADTVQGIYSALHYTRSNFEVFNLGNHQTVSLSEMIATIEEVFGKKAIINRLPEQPGDVPITYADISKAQQLLGYSPKTPFREGIIQFKNWLLAQ